MAVSVSRCVGASACAASLVLLCPTASRGQGDGDQPARDLAIAAGRATYTQFCSPCHGTEGRGHGPVLSILATPLLDLTQLKRRYKQFPLEKAEQILVRAQDLTAPAHGSGQMPAWEPVFRSIDSSAPLVRARVANLLAYLESLQE